MTRKDRQLFMFGLFPHRNIRVLVRYLLQDEEVFVTVVVRYQSLEHPVSTVPNPTDFRHSLPWITMEDPIPSAVETLMCAVLTEQLPLR